ncbi:peptidylprolyl isomerase [Streptomyces agglomeratus]|uniref:Peptidyl-prolyl cis-trans isomerase n=1 Tax=Streptomyces agglomeratus TaxID=285458 RepID=A0A1E5PE68_9ACTN|nr:peptidylprolyl isomerase [Streptomyces agglomeratus]OEJ27832.1 peptidylprolyl isomerase [Streptomyces agglomeratus]OEJ38109.1 peptidylprolyl isomerase [Streptomyces agglomeratus]OEJ47508.1 peptidylprolyl isomerase [Streptomyces agglomeratus]OEJ50636.1 peptidylprolyl isomerase [Streptomyces agglomeratus]OEJ57998.1 peptidylprolyl isomerase [Streptomyces agglomeratus]
MVSSDQRRRQLAREKFERQQQRRAENRRRARRRNAVIASALAVVLAAGATAFATGALGGDDKDDTVTDAAASTPSKAPDPCEKPAPGSVKKLSYKKEPALTVDKSASYTMKLDTTCGDITLALDAAKAPRTVNSFNFLAGKGYFDHTKCHRLTTSGIYVLQCGDPTAQGSGTPGYKLPDENLKDPKLKGGVYPAGTVAMANAGPGTGGSQFFLVYQDSKLPPNYSPFGTIKGGKDVLKKIADAGEATGAGDGAPNATVVIDKATVTK